jgi:hypothetical protein
MIDQIRIEVVDHAEQRYNTVGDWGLVRGTLVIRVSEMPNELHWSIAMHELAEAILCIKAGVSPEKIDTFDAEFEKHAKGNEEPGDDPRAPYHSQHQVGLVVERLMVAQMGWSWKEYEAIVDEPYIKRRKVEQRKRENLAGKNPNAARLAHKQENKLR